MEKTKTIMHVPIELLLQKCENPNCFLSESGCGFAVYASIGNGEDEQIMQQNSSYCYNCGTPTKFGKAMQNKG